MSRCWVQYFDTVSIFFFNAKNSGFGSRFQGTFHWFFLEFFNPNWRGTACYSISLPFLDLFFVNPKNYSSFLLILLKSWRVLFNDFETIPAKACFLPFIFFDFSRISILFFPFFHFVIDFWLFFNLWFFKFLIFYLFGLNCKIWRIMEFGFF